MQVELTSDVLSFTGELNNLTVPDAAQELSRLLKGETVSSIDLGELTMIDSAGVAFLDEVHQELTQDSKQQIFANVPPPIQAMIDT
ncbi:MAG: STAS domain-containing protein, partial [Candidatus Cloacimonetes bacterium]|nr:STAS domain-containing protein [Candidatus Cloacimonadota bacterium]